MESFTLIDDEAGATHFTHYENPGAQPVKIKRVDKNHWIVVLETYTSASPLESEVKLEPINNGEFRVVIQKKPTR